MKVSISGVILAAALAIGLASTALDADKHGHGGTILARLHRPYP